jgi:hypothetical protein
MIPVFSINIHFNPLMQFCRFLTELEYPLIGEKFLPTSALCTLYTVTKKGKIFQDFDIFSDSVFLRFFEIFISNLWIG